MKIFITGATGFIGTHAARLLVKQGHQLVCLVRKTSHIQELEKLDVDLVWGDVRDRKTILPGMSGCEALIHLAGTSSFWESHKKIYAEVNVNGTRNVMECALETGISRVIHVSPLYVYGKPAQAKFNEESTIGPQRFSELARSKYEAERIAWVLHYKKGLPLTVCYPAVVLGPGRNRNRISPVRRIMSYSLFSRSSMNSAHTYIHVQDVAEAISRVLTLDGAVGKRYFIAHERISTRRLLAAVSEVIGSKTARVILPDSLAMFVAGASALVARVLNRPPFQGMSPEYLMTLQNSLMADGSRSQKELGMAYTPIGDAIKEEIDSIRMAWSIQERRKSRRYPLLIDVVYKAQGDASETTGRLIDISENGLLLSTAHPCPKGRYLSINLSGDGKEGYVMARGRVVRRTRDIMAIDFTHKDKGINGMVACRGAADKGKPCAELQLPSPQGHV